MSNKTNEELFEGFWKKERGDLVIEASSNITATDYQLYEWEKQSFLKACELKDTEITLLKENFEKIRKELEWAVDTAYYWVDNIGDRQKCVDLEYKYKLIIDKDDKW